MKKYIYEDFGGLELDSDIKDYCNSNEIEFITNFNKNTFISTNSKSLERLHNKFFDCREDFELSEVECNN